MIINGQLCPWWHGGVLERRASSVIARTSSAHLGVQGRRQEMVDWSEGRNKQDQHESHFENQRRARAKAIDTQRQQRRMMRWNWCFTKHNRLDISLNSSFLEECCCQCSGSIPSWRHILNKNRRPFVGGMSLIFFRATNDGAAKTFQQIESGKWNSAHF